jgi:hypothetical protein
MEYGPQFADLLREVRQTLNQTQAIGRALGLGNGAWQSYEQCTKLPSIQNLFTIADKLAAKYGPAAMPSQAEFLKSWLQAHGIRLDDGLVSSLHTTRPRGMSLTEFSWLKPFVFAGERREQWARTRLDCLVAPAAVSDLSHIYALGLDRDTEIVPDKELTARPWEELVERYGSRDIVSISSGAVNAMTALLNDDMVFRFDVVPEARLAYRKFVRDMDLANEADLAMFQRCLAAADRLGTSEDPARLLREAGLPQADPDAVRVASDVSELLGGFTSAQFTSLFRLAVIDPLVWRRFQSDKIFDYAVISVAHHPFGDRDRIALVIAGTNGTATAAAVQLLARGELSGRPLGAVVNFHHRWVTDKSGRRSQQLVPNVITAPYKPEDIVDAIDRLVSGSSGAVRGLFRNWSDEDLEAWKELVRTLSGVLDRRSR